MKFRSHEELILDGALKAIFPLPANPDPARLEGVLSGYAGALAAIGRPVVADPDFCRERLGQWNAGEDDVEAPRLNIGTGTVAEIEAGLAEVAAELAHRTQAVAR